MEKVEKILDELRSRSGFDILDNLEEDILDEIRDAIHNIIYDL